MAINSHIHITSLTSDTEKIISDINRDSNVESVINVALNHKTAKETISIANNNSKFYSAIGVNPLYIKNDELDFLYDLSESDKVIAIGEIGLDSKKGNFQLQKELFIKQIIIANELYLPVIIHSNNMSKEIVEILKHNIKPEYGCVFHCLKPNTDVLKYLIDNNFYISFSRSVIDRKKKECMKFVKMVPSDLILVGDDTTYISHGIFKNKTLEYSDIDCLINRIAEIKEMNPEKIDRISSDNAKRLFKKML